MRYYRTFLTVCSLLFISFSAHAASISTLYASDNGGSPGGAVYFDLEVASNDLIITGFETNFSGNSAFNDFEAWLLYGTTSQGNESSSNWVQVATGSGVAAGDDNPTAITLSNTFTLDANTLYGIALVSSLSTGHEYTDGDGSNQSYSNNDLSLTFGTASNTPFSGVFFNPRVWNGSIQYDPSVSVVPVPAAAWLFGTALLGLIGFRRKKLQKS